MRNIYLDNAATTPIDKDVQLAMTPFFNEKFANPSAIYKAGVDTKYALESARAGIARVLGARASAEIVFTSGGTESDNLAIFGSVKSYCKSYTDSRPHIVVSSIEHSAVLEACKYLEMNGADVTYIGVDESGVVDPKDIKNAIRENTALVSVMYANNEIGTIQPIREIAKIVRGLKKESSSKYPYFHTDACQAVNYLDIDVVRLGVDMLTISGQKIYGPKGAGVLFVKSGINIMPMILGGGQENGMRGGTENVPAIIGLAKALEITSEMKEKEVARLTVLRDYFIERLLSSVKGSILNGGLESRLPNNINISFPDIDSEQLIIWLDAKGISASAASACQSSDGKPSYVILALENGGANHFKGEGSARFSLGRNTTKKDIDYVLKVTPEIINKITKKLV